MSIYSEYFKGIDIEALQKKVDDINNNDQFTDDECFAMSVAKPKGERKYMCFDWLVADAIIAEKKPDEAIAYLKNDFGNTCGTVYKDGHRIISEYHPYVGSIWAIPMLRMSFKQDDETYLNKDVPCFYTYDDPQFNPMEMWPSRFEKQYRIKEIEDERE